MLIQLWEPIDKCIILQGLIAKEIGNEKNTSAFIFINQDDRDPEEY